MGRILTTNLISLIDLDYSIYLFLFEGALMVCVF